MKRLSLALSLTVLFMCGQVSALTTQEVMPECALVVEMATTSKRPNQGEMLGVVRCLALMDGVLYGTKVAAKKHGVDLCLPDYSLGQFVAEWLNRTRESPSVWQFEAASSMAYYISSKATCR